MNCPKCNGELYLLARVQGPPMAVECGMCGWHLLDLPGIITASPAYRVAKLKAHGAEPGWYGPDGERLEFCVDSASMIGEGRCFCADSPEKLQQLARLCGFVEVTHEPM